nr:efflux RND transporter periplasmic adaptor subunit [Mangrovicoccus algicola]
MLALLAAAAVATSAICSAAMAQSDAPALTVSLVTPATRDWPETVPASGWLAPWQEAVIASEAGGLRITEILADVGSRVTKGDPLVRLTQEGILADIRIQQAAVETAKANLTRARSDADRARRLRESGTVSQQSLTDVLTGELTAQAALASEEAALESQRIRLDQTEITAIDDGVITSRAARLGAVVSPGTELFRMIRQGRIEWQAEVSARDLPLLAEGLAVGLEGPHGEAFRGAVRLVSPTVDTATGRATVYIALDADTPPRPGHYVTGSIELQDTPARTVPETAIVFRDGLNYLFTVGPDNRATRARVETGRRRDGEVEITSGLDPSARVVASGGAFLSDGVLVRVAEAGQ